MLEGTETALRRNWATSREPLITREAFRETINLGGELHGTLPHNQITETLNCRCGTHTNPFPLSPNPLTVSAAGPIVDHCQSPLRVVGEEGVEPAQGDGFNFRADLIEGAGAAAVVEVVGDAPARAEDDSPCMMTRDFMPMMARSSSSWVTPLARRLSSTRKESSVRWARSGAVPA